MHDTTPGREHYEPENGCCYRHDAAKAVLADREAELLALKGPCTTPGCRLHYAHSGPCDITEETR